MISQGNRRLLRCERNQRKPSASGGRLRFSIEGISDCGGGVRRWWRNRAELYLVSKNVDAWRDNQLGQGTNDRVHDLAGSLPSPNERSRSEDSGIRMELLVSSKGVGAGR